MPNFLERIRISDDQTKKRWLIGVSAAIMFLVIWVWLGYFNSLFVRPETTQSEPTNTFSFWDSVKGGSSAAWSSLTASMKNIGGMFVSPKEYIIQPQ